MHLYPIDGAVHDIAGGHRLELPERALGDRLRGRGLQIACAERVKRWSVDYSDALHPYSAGGAYVNMMMDEGQERVRASYRDNYARLARIKADRDPENLFRLNLNIHPAPRT